MVVPAGIGDVAELVAVQRVGVVVRALKEIAYREALRELSEVVREPCVGARCTAIAREHLDLQEFIWRRCRAMYEGVCR